MVIESAPERLVDTFDQDIRIVYKLENEDSCLSTNFYNKFKLAKVSY